MPKNHQQARYCLHIKWWLFKSCVSVGVGNHFKSPAKDISKDLFLSVVNLTCTFIPGFSSTKQYEIAGCKFSSWNEYRLTTVNLFRNHHSWLLRQQSTHGLGNPGWYKWLHYNKWTPISSMIYVCVKIHYSKSYNTRLFNEFFMSTHTRACARTHACTHRHDGNHTPLGQCWALAVS